MRWGPLWLLFSSAALAAPRTVTIAAGDCKKAELLSATLAFGATLAARPGADVLGSDAVLERFRPVPTITAEDLGRQLDAAQTQFYAGSYDRSLEMLRQSITAIQRLSPRADPWKLLGRALMLQGLVFKSANKKNEANDAHKRVLRIEPLFKLDPDYYTPATLQAFEALRAEVQKAKKVKLTVGSQPSGAEVFLDGALLGKTPFAREFPPGDYLLSLANGESLSFLHPLKLLRDEAIQIDLSFEGALGAQSPLCVNSTDAALKLAALAGADNLVVLRLESRNNEPGWVTAALLEVNRGAKVRDGGIRFTGPRRNEALTELAAFVLTGKGTDSVQAGASSPEEDLAAPAEALAEPVRLVEASAPRGVGPRITSFALMGAGAAAAIAGLGIYLSAGSDRSALASLVDEQGRVRMNANAEEAKAIQSRLDGNSTTSLLLGAGGAAAIAAGAAVFFLLPPGDRPQLSLTPTRDGFWAGAAFSF
jgi:hypothetical protein